MRVLIESAILDAADQQRLVDAFPQMALSFVDSAAAWLALAPEADVIFAKNAPLPALERAERLRWFQAGTAGVDRYLTAGILERGVTLTNARGAHGVPIAEQILTMALCFATRLHLLLRMQPGELPVKAQVLREKVELEGQTMLVVGLGDIGGTLAVKAHALGMRVLGVRRSGQPFPPCVQVSGPDGLGDLLAQADHVALCLPLTGATTGIIGERELRLMKHSAYIYNVGRGAAIDGVALRRTLAEGRIAGAGLDCVAPSDTPAADDPLWRMPNVILGLHTSGTSPYNSRRITDIFMANLERYLAGFPLHNVVDPQAGY